MSNWDFGDLIEDVLMKTSEKGSCCSSEVLFEDESKFKNPKNPKLEVSKEFIEELENRFSDCEMAYVNGIDDLFLHDYYFDFESAIVISYEMDQRILDSGAGARAQEYNNDLYESFGRLTYSISDYLRKNGYETYVAHPREEKINFSRLAERANMGCIGKSGLFISPSLGPRQKIAAILVNIGNLPVASENPHKWIRKYCEYCNSCIRKCPENALSYWDNKISFNQNLCIGCSQGCTECIRACPFYKRGYENVKTIYGKIKLKEENMN